MEKYSKLHDAQVYDRPPLVPFHFILFDPMHAVHNEFNALIDEVRAGVARGQTRVWGAGIVALLSHTGHGPRACLHRKPSTSTS